MMKDLGRSSLPEVEDYIRWLMIKGSYFEPGSKSLYCSSSFVALRIFINALTGDFFKFMEEKIFGPAGAEIGRGFTRPEDRCERECWYLTGATGPSPFPENAGAPIALTEGGGGFYFDPQLVPIVGAKYLALFATNWVIPEKNRIIADPKTGTLPATAPEWHMGYGGSWNGTLSWFEQSFGAGRLFSLAGIYNYREERPGKGEAQLCSPFHEPLVRLGWKGAFDKPVVRLEGGIPIKKADSYISQLRSS